MVMKTAITAIPLQNILLVDNSEDDYEATARAFCKANMANPLLWCRSGQEALDFLSGCSANGDGIAKRPSMILLDLNMPGIDGYQLLEILKKDVIWRSIPIIILTTSSDERDIASCYRMGANSYIAKPVSFDGLIAAIKSLKEYWVEISLLPKSA